MPRNKMRGFVIDMPMVFLGLLVFAIVVLIVLFVFFTGFLENASEWLITKVVGGIAELIWGWLSGFPGLS